MSNKKRTGLIQGSRLHKKAIKTHTNPFKLSSSPLKTSDAANVGLFGIGGKSGYDIDKLDDAGYDYDMMKKRRWWKRGQKDQKLVAYNRGFENSDYDAMELEPL
tara:strand:+ start:35 stop:346 length:312 start_codon:yes stop_codon:yes gene_type:complete